MTILEILLFALGYFIGTMLGCCVFALIYNFIDDIQRERKERRLKE